MICATSKVAFVDSVCQVNTRLELTRESQFRQGIQQEQSRCRLSDRGNLSFVLHSLRFATRTSLIRRLPLPQRKVDHCLGGYLPTLSASLRCSRHCLLT